jgi:hypothetical protein
MNRFFLLACALATLLVPGCANVPGHGVSAVSPDRRTQLVDEIPAEGQRKIPVTQTRGP